MNYFEVVRETFDPYKKKVKKKSKKISAKDKELAEAIVGYMNRKEQATKGYGAANFKLKGKWKNKK